MSLEELAERSDYISCHLPLSNATRGMLDAAFFGAMKPTAYFINTGRGGVVTEADLIAALENGTDRRRRAGRVRVRAAGPDHPFLSMDQVVLTPHTASYADETFATRDHRVGKTALTILAGEMPQFVANRAVLDKLK